MKQLFQQIDQQEYHMRSIKDARKAKSRDEYLVSVQWEGLDDDDIDVISAWGKKGDASDRKSVRKIIQVL